MERLNKISQLEQSTMVDGNARVISSTYTHDDFPALRIHLSESSPLVWGKASATMTLTLIQTKKTGSTWESAKPDVTSDAFQLVKTAGTAGDLWKDLDGFSIDKDGNVLAEIPGGWVVQPMADVEPLEHYLGSSSCEWQTVREAK